MVVIFLPTRATRSGGRARFVELFQGCTGLWTAGCWLARRLHQLKASTTVDLGISFFLISVVVVVVVFTLTDRASTIHSNIRGCQSGTWSQRGTKVNGSHHGDNPLLRPTGIQIATKSYATLQAMAPITKRFTKTPLLHIESSLDRLGLLSPTHDQRSQQQIGQTRSNQF